MCAVIRECARCQVLTLEVIEIPVGASYRASRFVGRGRRGRVHTQQLLPQLLQVSPLSVPDLLPLGGLCWCVNGPGNMQHGNWKRAWVGHVELRQ